VNNNAYQISRAMYHNGRTGRALDKLSRFVKADFMAMPFEDASFDAVYQIDATCHAPDQVGCYKVGAVARAAAVMSRVVSINMATVWKCTQFSARICATTTGATVPLIHLQVVGPLHSAAFCSTSCRRSCVCSSQAAALPDMSGVQQMHTTQTTPSSGQ
jgi:Methyltransferase domain